jgi:hypothetical protein
MGAYTNAVKRVSQWDFSIDSQPTVAMNVVTTIERVQPYCSGVNAQGRFIWEGREMPRWQRELLRVAYYGDFMAYWIKRRFEDATGYEAPADMPSMELRAKKLDSHKRKHHKGD